MNYVGNLRCHVLCILSVFPSFSKYYYFSPWRHVSLVMIEEYRARDACYCFFCPILIQKPFRSVLLKTFWRNWRIFLVYKIKKNFTKSILLKFGDFLKPVLMKLAFFISSLTSQCYTYSSWTKTSQELIICLVLWDPFFLSRPRRDRFHFQNRVVLIFCGSQAWNKSRGSPGVTSREEAHLTHRFGPKNVKEVFLTVFLGGNLFVKLLLHGLLSSVSHLHDLTTSFEHLLFICSENTQGLTSSCRKGLLDTLGYQSLTRIEWQSQYWLHEELFQDIFSQTNGCVLNVERMSLRK